MYVKPVFLYSYLFAFLSFSRVCSLISDYSVARLPVRSSLHAIFSSASYLFISVFWAQDISTIFSQTSYQCFLWTIRQVCFYTLRYPNAFCLFRTKSLPFFEIFGVFHYTFLCLLRIFHTSMCPSNAFISALWVVFFFGG